MSSSYERINANAETEFLMLRAKILLDQEVFLPPAAFEPESGNFPRWLHVLSAKGNGALSSNPAGNVQWKDVVQGMAHGDAAVAAADPDHAAPESAPAPAERPAPSGPADPQLAANTAAIADIQRQMHELHAVLASLAAKLPDRAGGGVNQSAA